MSRDFFILLKRLGEYKTNPVKLTRIVVQHVDESADQHAGCVLMRIESLGRTIEKRLNKYIKGVNYVGVYR